MISNITAGNVDQIQSVINQGIIPLVLDIIAGVCSTLFFCICLIFAVKSVKFFVHILFFRYIFRPYLIFSLL